MSLSPRTGMKKLNVVVVYFNPKCEKKETGESLGAHQIATLA